MTTVNDSTEDRESDDLTRDAHEVGCYGLVGCMAARNKTGERVHASQVTRADGPFHCPDCLTDAVVRKCTERVDHFAHKARLSPVLARGETALHKACKNEIRDELIARFPDGKWECERVIKPNKEKNTPRLIPDVSGRIDDLPVVIEIQASCLTVSRIIKRAAAYRALNCAILWIVPLKEELGELPFRPRLFERYLHTMYFGRTYYWMPGDGLLLRPVHYGVAYRYIDMSEWYEAGGEHRQAGGYDKPYKIVKMPYCGRRVDIVDHFHWEERGEFVPRNEKKAIPPLYTWQDDLKRWWDEEEQQRV